MLRARAEFRMKTGILKICVAVAIVAGVEFFIGWGELFALVGDVARKYSDSAFLFFCLMSVGCAFGFPLSLCYLLSGAAFGFLRGWGVCVAVLAVSSAIGYALGRFFFPDSVVRGLLRKIPFAADPCGAGMFNVNFAVRVVPGIPYWAQNAVLGGIRTRFALYMAVNLIGQGAIAGAMNFFASTMAEEGERKYAAFAVLVAVLAVFHIAANVYYKKIRRRKPADSKE